MIWNTKITPFTAVGVVALVVGLWLDNDITAGLGLGYIVCDLAHNIAYPPVGNDR